LPQRALARWVSRALEKERHSPLNGLLSRQPGKVWIQVFGRLMCLSKDPELDGKRLLGLSKAQAFL